jgi:hypothetical protein
VSWGALSVSVDRIRRHSRGSCVLCGLDLDPHMSPPVDDDRPQYRPHIAHQIVVGLHGLSRLRDRHLCAVSLLEVHGKVTEIGSEIDVIR